MAIAAVHHGLIDIDPDPIKGLRDGTVTPCPGVIPGTTFIGQVYNANIALIIKPQY